MTAHFATALESARNNLTALGQAADRISDQLERTDALSDDDQRQIDRFRAARQEAAERLAAPRLLLATVGTTSSGKSTFVNALAGRTLAPIEAGEMSGGVLSLQHASARLLHVQSADDEQWEGGSWHGITDADAYARVQGVMKAYHSARKEKDVAAPRVTFHGPLLPAADPGLFGLDPSLSVAFADLPGLKSTLDRANLAVIQQEVNRAFCLVVLDYAQTDEQNRHKLLAELKDIVDFLGGRTDTLLFVLNRVDLHGFHDDPLAERVSLMRSEIQNVLGLDDLPDLLPLRARLLHYAQSIWGPAPLSGSPDPPANQGELVQALHRDCATERIDLEDENPAAADAWSRVRAAARKGDPIPTDDLRLFVRAAWDYSGGNAFRDRMKDRVARVLPSLVLAPALQRVVREAQALAAILRPLVRIQLEESRQALAQEKRALAETVAQFESGIADIHARFRDDLNSALTDLKSDVPAHRARVSETLGEGFASLTESVSQVSNDLTETLIAPVSKAIADATPAHDVEDALKKVVPDPLAADLAQLTGGSSRISAG